jgi:signal transduction histidine kinase/CheY-like chemotaxis protein
MTLGSRAGGILRAMRAGIGGASPAAFWRFTPVIAVTIAVAMVAAGFLIALRSEHDHVQRRTREVAVQAKILASTVSAALAFSDRAAAEEYVAALQENPEMLNAAIYDASGKLFAEFSRGTPAPVHAPSGAFRLNNAYIAVVTPISQRRTNLGTVYLRALTDPPARRIFREGTIALLMSMAALVVAVLGVAASTLRRANDELRQQTIALAATNTSLLYEIEERKKAQAALHQAQKVEAIGQLTGGVAHDFNNLLQIILSALNAMRRRAPRWGLDDVGARDFHRFLDAAVDGGQRAASLTRQLLAFARRQQLEPTRIDSNVLVTGMTELLRRTLGEAVVIETQLAPDVWPIFVDRNQLESALLNLAVNARDAMTEGGHLTVATENLVVAASGNEAVEDLSPGHYVRIVVTDTGCGMSADTLGKAFEPFFTTKDVGHGTGLGLSQVYGFVKQSGGHVKIDSAPGQGTKVQLFLPRLMTPQAETAPASSDHAVPLAKGSETILVVEDEDQVRAFSVDMLTELGYRVAQAANGAAALRVLDADPSISLLFTDVGLPGGMNGQQLAEEALLRRPNLKVLFVSGYSREAIINRGRAGASMALIGKPFTYPVLAQKIRELLGAE